MLSTPYNFEDGLGYFLQNIDCDVAIRYQGKLPLYKKLFKGELVINALWHLPSQAIDRKYRDTLDANDIKSTITIPLKVIGHYAGNRYTPYKILAQDQNGTSVSLTFFHAYRNFLYKIAPNDSHILVSGLLQKLNNGSFQIVHPDYIGDISKKQEWIGTRPIYPLTGGISQNHLRSVLQKFVKGCKNLYEWNDPHLLKQMNLPTFKQALQACHNPQTTTDITVENPARQRLILDEFLCFHLTKILSSRKQTQAPCDAKIPSHHLQKQLRNLLPFALTVAQERAIQEIQFDMKQPKQMLRLLQGDVGSGKTLVGIFAALHAIEANYQVAFLAPTEILAQQHFQTLSTYLKGLNLQTTLLTGREKGNIRKSILQALALGNINILVGTHAILQKWVEFANLGLVIIDEQQRFGVEQRMLLSAKGKNPDILSMTATPIPRTLQLAQYGEMELSFLKEKPPGRKSITTSIINENKIEELIERLGKLVEEKQQIYWVCPLVEESETSDLMAAKKRYKHLSEKFNDKVGLVHGKMPSNNKEEVVRQFSQGKIQILVATTVIEVGINVPNATVMIVEHAERFGLSQLHQLRGRVGRSDLTSSCILLYYTPLSFIAKQRLEAIRSTNDGFAIAEADLKLRGAGELFGIKQSGIPKFLLSSFDQEEPKHNAIVNDLFAVAHKEALKIASQPLSLEREKAIQSLFKIFNYENASLYKHSG